MGEKLAVYSLQTGTNNGVPFANVPSLCGSACGSGKKAILRKTGQCLATGRKQPGGSARRHTSYEFPGQYYPYGDESPVTPQTIGLSSRLIRRIAAGFDYTDQRLLYTLWPGLIRRTPV